MTIQSQRNTEWAGLERAMVGKLVQPPCPGRVALKHIASMCSLILQMSHRWVFSE